MAIDMNDYLGKNNNSNNNNKPPFNETPEFIRNFGKKAGLIYVSIAVLLLLVIARPFVIINSGEVGILVTLGKFEKEPLHPGIHFFAPFIQKVITVDTRVRVVNYTRDDVAANNAMPTGQKGIIQNAPITVLDSRGLPVDIELTVQYSLKPVSASEAIASLGLNWEEKTITPNSRDVVRSVIGNFAAEELPVKRNTIAQLITEGMSRALTKLQGQPVNLISVQLRGIVLPDKVKEQIERVQIANQEAEKAKYEVEKAKQVAEARRIEAKGIADSQVIQAEGQSKANDLVGKSLNTNLIKLKQVEAQQKFNEALTVNKDAKIFLTPGGAVPNVWMDMKSSDDKAKASGSGK